MKHLFALASAAFALFSVFTPSTSFGSESLNCYSFGENAGVLEISKTEFARVAIDDQKQVSVIIQTEQAMRDLTFKNYSPVEADGSNFARWFEYEATDLTSADGKSVSYSIDWIGAYAGVSPLIDSQYSMYAALEQVAQSLNQPMPLRTLVVFDDGGHPLQEYFCN